MCTHSDDIEELDEIYGPLCWRGYKQDPGGHKKTWRGAKKGHQMIPSHCVDECDEQVEASCIMMLVEREPLSEAWWRLPVGGINNIRCQHLQVMLTNLLQKHWEWQEKREPMKETWECGATYNVCGQFGHQNGLWRCSAQARGWFDEKKQNMHGWLTSALLREMSELQGRATFEGVGTSIDVSNKGV